MYGRTGVPTEHVKNLTAFFFICTRAPAPGHEKQPQKPPAPNSLNDITLTKTSP
jgi:hypothetical protein